MGDVSFVTWIAIVNVVCSCRIQLKIRLYFMLSVNAGRDLLPSKRRRVRGENVWFGCWFCVVLCCVTFVFLLFSLFVFFEVCFACMHENVVNYRSNDDYNSPEHTHSNTQILLWSKHGKSSASASLFSSNSFSLWLCIAILFFFSFACINLFFAYFIICFNSCT